MTKDEAILRLEVLKDFSQNNELKNMHEAIDMAIEALENECMNVQYADMRGEEKHTMEEFMYGQDLGSQEDGRL